ncbi:MAG: alginate lyase family protein [Bacteroidota bacterium]
MQRFKPVILFHTIKYLRFKQIFYRIFYLVRNRIVGKNQSKKLVKKSTRFVWQEQIAYPNAYQKNNTFTFLNRSKEFGPKIDWNYMEFGTLWAYNLNYFDFLNAKDISVEESLYLIGDYVKSESYLKYGKDSYPISLRGINWIKFLSRNNISNNEIDQSLYNHYQILYHNLEYHLLGNHLLENAFSLFFASYYFDDGMFYEKANKLLKEELDEQILKDGAHFELSPMYHQIILYRLLDCINLVRICGIKKDNILSLLEEKARAMLLWLEAVTFSNGNVPMVNDCAYGISFTSNELRKYAESLGITCNEGELLDSGYRMFRKTDYEIFVDMGNIGPKYQPGHAHSDTFSFELYVRQQPVIVDTGTSTYEKNKTRQMERETSSHNTVKIGNQEQSQVWGGFRVAKRAEVFDLSENSNSVMARHNGYKNIGVVHTRKITAEDSEVKIEDELSKSINTPQVAFFHFHPTVKTLEIDQNRVKLRKEGITILFGNDVVEIQQQNFEYAKGFNKTEKSLKIAVSFHKSLKTSIIV